LMTELGRQPWIVFGLMRTEFGVSQSVPGWSVLVSLVVFAVLYGALMVVDVYLLRKYAKSDPALATESVAGY
jgi:cytochrome bd ubiquinol oxidase subunit I